MHNHKEKLFRSVLALVLTLVMAVSVIPGGALAATSAEIQKQIATLNKKLPSFKQIHKLEFRKTEFEKTSSKKIKRFLV